MEELFLIKTAINFLKGKTLISLLYNSVIVAAIIIIIGLTVVYWSCICIGLKIKQKFWG